ncbi:hypothetical protein F4860DRAFT_512342 [Xylaria cubensis]|nr:hypothetical protein F4860DRAFT_512342 [Xylaria cubensis]
MIPWLKTNQSVADDGSLQIHYAYFDDSTSPTNEPLNATIHVWQQTNLPSLDFPRANINFKVRNERGLCRSPLKFTQSRQ